jgi:proteasome lid subunit RPN8/RPN11
MLILSETLYAKIIAHARAGLPNEACGLFAGTLEQKDGDEVKTVRDVYCLKNTDESPEHFSMAPEEQFAAIALMRKNDFALLGNFHSHPATPARPSAEDIKLAFDPKLSYIIVSLMDGSEIVKSFTIDKEHSAYTEETLSIS